MNRLWRDNKGMAVVLGVVAIVLFLGVAGFIGYKIYSTKKKSASEPSLSTLTFDVGIGQITGGPCSHRVIHDGQDDQTQVCIDDDDINKLIQDNQTKINTFSEDGKGTTWSDYPFARVTAKAHFVTEKRLAGSYVDAPSVDIEVIHIDEIQKVEIKSCQDIDTFARSACN